jgi:hypothetical protein
MLSVPKPVPEVEKLGLLNWGAAVAAEVEDVALA